MNKPPKPLRLFPILAMTICLIGLIAVLQPIEIPRRPLVDCSLATFHPDFTFAMREQCRQAKKATKP